MTVSTAKEQDKGLANVLGVTASRTSVRRAMPEGIFL